MKTCFVLAWLLLFSAAFGQESKIVTNKFYSASLGRNISLTIYKPAQFSLTADPYRAFIYLHGAAGSVSWDYAGFMKPILDRLISNGDIDPLLVIFPVIRFQTVHGKTIPYDIHMYADSERNGKYESAITNDLLEWLENSYNISTRREQRGIGGFSMGAAACVPIAVRHNDKFSACIAHDGQSSIKSYLLDLPGLLAETPGPPYNFDINNGLYSAFWYAFASAFSPNFENPNMPEWFFDFPIDNQGKIIDSVFTRWMKNFDPATLIQNPDIYKNDIAIYIDATSEERRYNDPFHNELLDLGIPHSYWVINGSHGIYEKTEEAGLRFLDAAMDSAMQKIVYDNDVQVYSSPRCITSLNMYCNRNFEPQAKVKNLGKEIQTNLTVICKIENNGTVEYSDAVIVDTLKINQSKDIYFKGWRYEKSVASYGMSIVTELTRDENRYNDTLKTTLEISELVDNFESGFYKWTSENGWGVSNFQPYEGEFCLDDKPFSNYDNNADTWATYYSSFDLSQLKEAHLSFWTRHFFQKDNNDAGYVQISIDSGKTWQQLGQEFKASQNKWYEKKSSLTEYCGSGFDNVWLRFRLSSDADKTAAGWFIDEIYIHPADITAIQNERQIPRACQLFNNYPNPFNSQTTIRYHLDQAARIKLEIYNSLGQKIKTLFDERQVAGEYHITWNGCDETDSYVSSGLYMYKLEFDSYSQIKKMVLLR